MIKYLKQILYDLKVKRSEKEVDKKIWALETAIEILEDIKRGGDNYGNSNDK